MEINIKPLELNIVKVGNAKMTKSVFNQIRYADYIFDHNLDLLVVIIGYVYVDYQYFLFLNYKGNIYKKRVYEKSNFDYKNSIIGFFNLSEKDKILIRDEKYLKPNDLKKFKELEKKIISTYEEYVESTLKKRQLFISM